MGIKDKVFRLLWFIADINDDFMAGHGTGYLV